MKDELMAVTISEDFSRSPRQLAVSHHSFTKTISYCLNNQPHSLLLLFLYVFTNRTQKREKNEKKKKQLQSKNGFNSPARTGKSSELERHSATARVCDAVSSMRTNLIFDVCYDFNDHSAAGVCTFPIFFFISHTYTNVLIPRVER